MNGLAKRKEKSLLSNYLPPLRKKDVLSCVLFQLTIVWFETTTKTRKKTKNKKTSALQIGKLGKLALINLT